MKIKYSFILKPAPSKNGLYPIYLRAFKSGRKIELSTSVRIHKNDWSNTMQRVLKKNSEHKKMNKIIETYDKKALQILVKDYLEHDGNISLKTLKQKLTINDKGCIDNNNFIEFSINYLEQIRKQIKIETFWSYKSTISKLNKFKQKICFNDITEKFLHEFKDFMFENLKNNENTVSKSLRTLRTFINVAIRNKRMRDNPFDFFRIKKVEGQRAYLGLEELDKLFTFYKNEKVENKVQSDVLRSFLFSCYTGLRYSDIKLLRVQNIINDFIEIKMKKTGSSISIPLSKKAKYLMPDILKNGEDFLFRVYCNKVSNKHLKAISLKLKINKLLTFHVARHTFATTSLTLGIPIEVVSKLLGHTNIRTTQIYARVVDSVKVNEMKKWDKI